MGNEIPSSTEVDDDTGSDIYTPGECAVLYSERNDGIAEELNLAYLGERITEIRSKSHSESCGTATSVNAEIEVATDTDLVIEHITHLRRKAEAYACSTIVCVDGEIG